MQDKYPIEVIRHSAAHVLGAAIQKLWPDAQFGVGPQTDRGFFYDIRLAQPLTDADLKTVEETMKEIVKAKTPFIRDEWPIEKAISFMEDRNQAFKVELLNLLKTKGTTALTKDEVEGFISEDGKGASTVSMYMLGDFIDLCRGPHVDHAGDVAKFKLMSVSGAYWRGNQNNPQLQRIHAFGAETTQDLDKIIWQHEEAKKRDHRRIGKDLGIFTFADDIGSGLPLWLPNGTIIRDELEYMARREEFKAGFQRVSTPHLAKGKVYEKSGHLPYYAEDMYAPIDINGEDYYLRPMNCPHHHHIYMDTPKSYRELPVRLAEYGQVYRYEDSGALSGLMRVRGFCQNDAHIYVSEEQAEQEFLQVMQMHAKYYDMFEIEDYYMRLSLPDLNNLGKYVNEPEEWMRALDIIRSAMKRSGYPYKEVEGEAAFYGPKVDFMIKSAIGTEFAISTNQLDFLAAKKFGLTYTGEDGAEHPVYVIHRAPLGSHERFVAFLLEHYAGAFPTWLSPVQAKIIPIADRHVQYGKMLANKMTNHDVKLASGGLRVQIDDGHERMQKKIAAAQQQKIPYMLIVGDKEIETNTVSVRLRGGENLGSIAVDALIDRMSQESNTRMDIKSVNALVHLKPTEPTPAIS